MDNDFTPNYSFAIVSLILGILTIVFICCSCISIPLGIAGIIFAILSRNGSKVFLTQSIIGLILSIIGIVLSILILIITVSNKTQMSSPEFQKQIEEIEDYMEFYMDE